MVSTIQKIIRTISNWLESQSEVINNFAKGVVIGNQIVSNGGGVYTSIEA